MPLTWIDEEQAEVLLAPLKFTCAGAPQDVWEFELCVDQYVSQHTQSQLVKDGKKYEAFALGVSDKFGAADRATTRSFIEKAAKPTAEKPKR